MTAPATLPGTTPPGSQGDDEFDHLYCCDENRSLCGLDMTDYSVVEDIDDAHLCPWCEAVSESGLPCGPDCPKAAS